MMAILSYGSYVESYIEADADADEAVLAGVDVTVLKMRVPKTRACSARPVPMWSVSGMANWARPRTGTEWGRRTNGGSGTRMRMRMTPAG